MSLGAPDALTLAEPRTARTGMGCVARRHRRSRNCVRYLPRRSLPPKADPGRRGFSTVIDGRLLTEPVADTYAAGRQAHVPLWPAGTATSNPSMADGMTAEKWKACAERLFGEHAGEFLALYPGDTDAQAVRSAIDLRQRAVHRLRHLEVDRRRRPKPAIPRSTAITSSSPRRPASSTPAPTPFTPTTSSTSSEPSIRGPAPCGVPRTAS